MYKSFHPFQQLRQSERMYTQRVPLRISNDSLVADMGAFQPGRGFLTVKVFSNKKFQLQYLSDWNYSADAVIVKESSFSIQGPENFADPKWFPRVQLKDAIGHEATVALRPEDPYFEVKDSRHPLYKLVVDRTYWKTKGGINTIASATWEGEVGVRSVINTTFFKILPQQIGNRQWNHISIVVLFETNAMGEAWVLSLEHDI